jgi:hypothetical protein
MRHNYAKGKKNKGFFVEQATRARHDDAALPIDA